MSVVQMVEPETDIRAAMREIGAKARAAAREVANAPGSGRAMRSRRPREFYASARRRS